MIPSRSTCRARGHRRLPRRSAGFEGDSTPRRPHDGQTAIRQSGKEAQVRAGRDAPRQGGARPAEAGHSEEWKEGAGREGEEPQAGDRDRAVGGSQGGGQGATEEGGVAPTYARRLGLFSGTMAVIGGIIGGGIFRTPATVAERVGTPALTLAVWAVGGVIALIGALCFAELGQRRPRAGGGYVYLRETWGPLTAFLYGWALLLVIATGAMAAVAVTFAGYALALAGLSARLTVPVAIGAIVLLTGINYLGVKPAAVTQNAFTILKLAALAVLIVAGLSTVTSAAPYRPLPPAAAPGGVVGVAVAV